MATHKTTSTHRKQSRKWLLHDLNQQDIFRESHFLRSLDGLQTPVYTFSWSNSRQDRPFIAIGGYDEYPDRSELSVAYFDRQTDKAKLLTTAKHPYTPAKTAWMPCAVESAVSAPLIATVSDTLHLWKLSESSLKEHWKPQLDVSDGYAAPFTSLSWCAQKPALLACTSVTGRCDVWDLEEKTLQLHMLVHHNCPVLDVEFMPFSDQILASVGEDGNLFVYDLRSTDECKILLSKQNMKLYRLAWNPGDPYYIAVVALDTREVMILDTRQPDLPFMLKGHTKSPTCITWDTSNPQRLCSGGEDCMAFVCTQRFLFLQRQLWNVSTLDVEQEFVEDSEIYQVSWIPQPGDCFGIGYSNKLHICCPGQLPDKS